MGAEAGLQTINTGQVLIFENETNLRVMRKTSDRVWAKRIELHHPDDVEVVDSKSSS